MEEENLPYEISPYSIENLKNFLVKQSSATPEIVESKLHIVYFRDYFDALEAKTILIENDYIDRDFFDDFTGYYIRCFNDYGRKCTRFHFFNIAFTQEDFEILLKGAEGRVSQDDLKNAYLGFIVIKPLPQTVIGRTCLKTYPSDGDRRYFPSTRTYDANLFGILLQVKTVAFQEQDSVVAACATSALWSLFQITALKFNHPIPTPIEITKAATSHFPLETRVLPNKEGLTKAHMAHAIRSVGLEPFLVNAEDEYVLKNTLYAYLHFQIPAVLIVFLFDTSNQTLMARHAVTVTGYSLGNNTAIPYGPTGFLLRGSRIDKIYAHDDQVGPFARMIFDNVKVKLLINGNLQDINTLHTSWKGSDGQIGSIRAIPEVIFVPLYHKIRIPFYLVHNIVVPFDGFIESIRQQGMVPPLQQRLEWEIYLTTVNDLKSNILESRHIDGEYSRNILLTKMPRFIWRAIARCADIPLLELLFDATDIEQGPLFFQAIEYDKTLSVILRTLSKDPNVITAFKTKPEWKIFKWFEKQ